MRTALRKAPARGPSKSFLSGRTCVQARGNVPIYGDAYYLYVFPSLDAMSYGHIAKDIGPALAAALGISDKTEKGYGRLHYDHKLGSFVVCLVAFPESKGLWLSTGMVAHEVSHAARFVLSRAAVDLGFDNDEPEAYLTGWLMSRVHRMLENAGIGLRPASELD